MTTRLSTVAFWGVEAKLVDVQVLFSNGLPAFSIVGLPDKAVAESRDRIKAALSASNISLPAKRITVNLAPADLPKEGSHFDLPIALGILGEIGFIPKAKLKNVLAIGELALDGKITKISGVLPAAITAKKNGLTIICPQDSAEEAAWANQIISDDDEKSTENDFAILSAGHINSYIHHFRGNITINEAKAPSFKNDDNYAFDFSDVKGQSLAKRALEITAAGGHNMLMVGPPGSGKSMLSERLITILPPLEPKDMLNVAMISSIKGTLDIKNGIDTKRPYRAPHHSASMPALIGGGVKANPGEISMAHGGVLFLDELPEFQTSVLESLRQPLEKGEVVVSRANRHVTYPAKFQLLAAMNPCKCGYYGEIGHICKKGERCKDDYQAKLSGPFLDRIDIQVRVDRVSYDDLTSSNDNNSIETSEEIKARVIKARNIQKQRYAEYNLDFVTNSELNAKWIDKFAKPDQKGEELLKKAAMKFNLSARGYHRVMKVARTIADLEGDDNVSKIHIAEALSYRVLNT